MHTETETRQSTTVLLNRQQVADQLGVSPRQVGYLTAAGELPSLKIRGSRRWPADGIERYIADRLAESAAS